MSHVPAAKQKQVKVVVMDEYAVVHAWLNEKVASGDMKPADAQERMKDYESNAKSWTAPLKDGFGNARLIVKIARDMKTWRGRVYFRMYKGAEYVIIKGRVGLRSLVTGTRYKTTHPKMVELQIGKPGLKAAAKESMIFGALFVTAIDITDYFLRDSATIGQLCGTLTTDLGKVAIGAAIGYAAGAAAAGLVIGTFAIGPLVVALVVGTIVGIALDKLDEHFHVTDRLNQAFENMFAKLDHLRREKAHEFEAWLLRLEKSRLATDLSHEAGVIWQQIHGSVPVRWAHLR